MQDRSLRDFDLRSSYPTQLREILKESFPQVMRGPVDREALHFVERAFKSGVPFDYLFSQWEDYQVPNREPLRKAMEFARQIRFHIHAGTGLLIIGESGRGKSFLSYMIASEAIEVHKIPTLCVSIREWVDKKKFIMHNPALYVELLEMLNAARLVIIDNLSSEGEKKWWDAEDLFDLIDRVTAGGRRKRCVVMNTNMGHAAFSKRAGWSIVSRAFAFSTMKITRESPDFRENKADIDRVIAHRATLTGEPPCMKRLPFEKTGGSQTSLFPCARCVYSTRVYLCELRFMNKWKPLGATVSEKPNQ
jgi:DNA replication protein DnaC